MTAPAGVGLSLLHVTIALLVLSWVTVAGRLSVRTWLRPEAMGLDDCLMCAGLVLYSVTCALVIACCFYGAGQYSKYLTTAIVMQGTKLFYIAEFFYAACTVPIKSSICICLLRITDARRRFAWPLWGLVALQSAAAVIFIVTIGQICHPAAALWGETSGVCNAQLNSHISFFFSGVSIVTDISLAILPALLLWPVQMERRLKFSVVVILGMAAFASCATIIRLRYLTLYNNQAEFMYSAGPIGLWSVIEEGIGIIAGSLPALRPLLSLSVPAGTLRGRLPSESAERTPEAWGDEVQVDKNEFDMGTMVSGPVVSTRDSDGESQTHILKEISVTAILKETSVTVLRSPSSLGAAEEWKRRRVNGWDAAEQ